MSDAIAKALAAAADEAAQTPQHTTTAAPPAPVAPAASLPAAGGAPRTLADFINNAAMNVEVYLAVSELGIRLGKDKQLHDAIDVEMCLKHAKTGWVLRVNTPSGVRYLTTYDRVTEQRSGQNWATVVAQAQQMDASVYVSDLVELPVKLLKEYKRKEGAPLPAGTIVGLSLSYQNSKGFGGFLQDAAPRFGMDAPFEVTLTAKPKVGSGQEYGVFAYEILGEAGASATKGKKAA
ncbi:hypothetical protein [Methylorubrum suomiense]|uniref:Uncharacterized protein n=1 Tax=Methylorubrum suomiense TaxID=144191 RepID=A0ABQ4V0L9_9HYPH|nr:hypothetical protein [Methylorubrum suomiense]GJE78135.1 hypothetical protein BGCPKDLD_4746 [Methylorubrum suomiense]